MSQRFPGQFALVLLLIATLFSSVTLAQRTEEAPDPIVTASNDFGFRLARTLEEDGNLFYSPASISTALQMALVGARGETASEMAKVLGLGDFDPGSAEFDAAVKALVAKLEQRFREDPRANEGGKPKDLAQLDLVNALWGQTGHPFLESYERRLARTFGSELHQLDFRKDPMGSRQTINDRVAEQTQEKIRELLPADAITPETLLVLTNAIYFKNAWSDAFREAATKQVSFERRPGESFMVPMMHRTSYYRYVETGGARVLRVPYEHGKQSMLLVLPKKRHDLASIERSFDAQTLAKVRRELRDYRNRDRTRNASLALPRFKIEQSFELISALQSLGMRLATTPTKADFSGIDGGAGQLFISRVIHKTFIDVDEKGTEAAAATAVVMKIGAAAPRNDPMPFVCDEPFLFFIMDDATGLVLFQGRCADPRG